LKRKVLIVAPTQGVYGGIEVTVLTLAKWLAAHSHYEPVIAFKRVSRYDFKEELITTCEASGIRFHLVERMSRDLLKLIHSVDLVHGHNPSPDVFLMAKLLAKPYLLTTHNYRRTSSSPGAWLRRMLVHSADYRTYNSEFVHKTWETEPNPKSAVIPTLSELPQLPPSSYQRKGFFFVSRWIEKKGVRELIQAYQLAGLAPDEWPLMMAGRGPLEAWAKDYIAKHKLQGIHLLGFISEDTKNDQIARCKWMVTPPNTKEDMGLTPIEARHAGVPIIATRDGGIPESAGPAALLCTPGSSAELATLLRQAAAMPKEEYHARAQQGKDSLSSYLKPQSIYAEIYDELSQ